LCTHSSFHRRPSPSSRSARFQASLGSVTVTLAIGAAGSTGDGAGGGVSGAGDRSAVVAPSAGSMEARAGGGGAVTAPATLASGPIEPTVIVSDVTSRRARVLSGPAAVGASP
jgi:hypothetical protein